MPYRCEGGEGEGGGGGGVIGLLSPGTESFKKGRLSLNVGAPLSMAQVS